MIRRALMAAAAPLAFALAVAAAPAPAAEVPPMPLTAQPPHSTDLSLMPKWLGVLRRYVGEHVACAQPICGAGWDRLIAHATAMAPLAQLAEVNAVLNAVPYVGDPENWGREDYWATPGEFLARGGDCEDYAIAKYLALRSLGVPAAAMRIVVVRDEAARATHAVLVVERAGQVLVLDNNAAGLVPATAIVGYAPLYAVNEEGFWLYATLRELAR